MSQIRLESVYKVDIWTKCHGEPVEPWRKINKVCTLWQACPDLAEKLRVTQPTVYT